MPREPALAEGAAAPALPREWAVPVLAAAGIAAHLALRRVASAPAAWRPLPLLCVLAFGGAPLVWQIARRLWSRQFGSDALAGASMIASALMGEYLVGAILVLMLSGGAALERLAARRATSVLGALARRMPRVAHLRRGDLLRDVDISEIRVGDRLVVFPHELCPVDGVVVDGRGAMDESYLTGEPFRIAKTPGSAALSGAINGDSALTLEARRPAADSRYASIMRIVEDAERRRPRLRRLGDRLAAWFTPAALGVAGFAWVWSGDPRRFLAVLVAATPCPLLIAVPVAVLGAISLSAGRGIIVKDPAALEEVGLCRTVILDKTGTLTFGRPSLTDVLPARGVAPDEPLRLAASLEQFSRHPLSGAILGAARARGLALGNVAEARERPGVGLSGVVDGRAVLVTGRKFVDPSRHRLPPAAPGGLECLVFIDDALAAALRFHDAAQPESKPFLAHLPRTHRVSKLLLVSGDREAEVRYLADSVGVTDIAAGKSPEEKLAIVAEETRRAKTLFVGDGINDAPALLAATVGVAIGETSDVTAEAASVVLLGASIGKLDELIHIGRRMRVIVLESALGGMALSAAAIAAAAAGRLPPLDGAILQELIDLAAVLNAVRVSWPPRTLTDF